MVKNLKIDWKDFSLGFFIGVTLCLYSYVSQELDTNNTEPTSRITGMVVTEQGFTYALSSRFYPSYLRNKCLYKRIWGESSGFFPFFVEFTLAKGDNVLYSGSIKREKCI